MKANRIIKTILSLTFAVTFVVPTMSDVLAKDYEIVFRAGAHASFVEGSSKKTVEASYGEDFPDDPYTLSELKIEDGYVFKGWNEELPEKVEGKTTFVAKCVPVVSGQEYKVRYVDQNGVDVVTPLIGLANAGDTVTVYAKTVKDWPVDAQSKRLTIKEGTNEIQFVYQVPEDEVQTEYITEYQTNVVDQVTTVTTGGTNANAVGNANAQGTGDNTTTIEDNEVPQAGGETTDIEDNQTPLAKNPQESSNHMGYIIGGAGLVILLAVIAYIVNKRKHSQN